MRSFPCGRVHNDRKAIADIESLLSPFAIHSQGSSNQSVLRDFATDYIFIAGSERSPFEHDRDRILQSRQFRKLAGKTQMLTPAAASRFTTRTRLTHTLEVFQHATTIGRRLNLNLVAIEAIALGHDLGHTPFGHTGEAALRDLLKNQGGFHHAAHGVRTTEECAYAERVSLYERTTGLNLTAAVREGILRHGWFGDDRTFFQVYQQILVNGERGSFEAQAVKLADAVAYLNHDIADLRAIGRGDLVSPAAASAFIKRHSEQFDDPTEAQFRTLLCADEPTRTKILLRNIIDSTVDFLVDIVAKTCDKEPRIIYSQDVHAARDLLFLYFEEVVYPSLDAYEPSPSRKSVINTIYHYLCDLFSANTSSLPLHIKRCKEKLAAQESKKVFCKELVDKLVAPDFIALASADVLADLTDSAAMDLYDCIQGNTEDLARLSSQILETMPNEESWTKKQRDFNSSQHDYLIE